MAFTENINQTIANRAQQFAHDLEMFYKLPKHLRHEGKQMRFKLEFLNTYGKQYLPKNPEVHYPHVKRSAVEPELIKKPFFEKAKQVVPKFVKRLFSRVKH